MMHVMDLRALALRRDVDDALNRFMAAHHGLITFDQARELGASARLVQGRADGGAWVRMHHGVFRASAAPSTPEQSLLAAVWASGSDAVASHRSAAWLWRLFLVPPDMPDVSVPPRQQRGDGLFVLHRSTDLVGTVLSERQGIPVTAPARTILDAAAVVRPEVVALLIDRAVANKLLTVAGLTAVLEQYGRRGRRGAGKLRDALEARGVHAEGMPPSVLESRMARIARLMDAPPPVPEYAVAGGRFRFDFAWPEVRVGAEVHGWGAHSSFDDWKRNLAKRQWADDNDWLMPEYSWDDVNDPPEGVAARLSRILRRRALELRPELCD